MKRQRRKRSTRRRGLQHIGDVLSALVTDIEKDEAAEARAASQCNSQDENPGIPIATGNPQGTFSFYQPAEV